MKPGDPELNPWLPVLRTCMVKGYDVFGQPSIEFLKKAFLPDYYFWLGADAYPDFPVIWELQPPIAHPAEVYVVEAGHVSYNN